MSDAIDLQMARVTPIDPGDVAYGYRITGTTNDAVTVEVAMVSLRLVDEIDSLFVRHGVALPELRSQATGGSIMLRAAPRTPAAATFRRQQLIMRFGLLLTVALLPLTLIASLQIAHASVDRRLDAIRDDAAYNLRAAARITRFSQAARAARPLVAQPPSVNMAVELQTALGDLGTIRSVEVVGGARASIEVASTRSEEANARLAGRFADVSVRAMVSRSQSMWNADMGVVFSPLVQRFLAWALLVLCALLVSRCAVIPVVDHIGQSRGYA
ncbi:MAG: hypothetical protein HC774_03610 [Sphingomonadales bacterium]|nr:hypothetical protein [Sphingomonadales bacterium]